MPKTSARREAARRARQRLGVCLLTIPVELAPLRDRLLDAGLLAEWDDDDKRKIAEAVGRVLKFWVDNPKA